MDNTNKTKMETNQDLNALLTAREVSSLTKYSDRHIRNLVKEGKFPQPIRAGRTVRFAWDDIRRVLNGEFYAGLSNQAI